MPKIVDYPRASFKNSVEIATAVDYLGGSCSLISCADRLKKKVSGGFKAIVSASIKHGLVESKKEVLSTTELYRLYKLAYNEQEKSDTLRKAFLHPGLYNKLYERFKGKELPVSMLDKLLIREFGVEESYGSRIAGYFVDGAKSLQILENGKLVDNISVETLSEPEILEKDEIMLDTFESPDDGNSTEVVTVPIMDAANYFSIMIIGPGMNTKIQLSEEDDLLILDAMLNKIKKKLKEGSK